eukprot:COSAG06_NODE_2258_length_7221_cov_12.506599_9_plen_206_part_00
MPTAFLPQFAWRHTVPKKYVCESGTCVADLYRGVPLSECEAACTPAPGAKYTCASGRCVKGSTGTSFADCSKLCVAPAPTPAAPDPCKNGKNVSINDIHYHTKYLTTQPGAADAPNISHIHTVIYLQWVGQLATNGSVIANTSAPGLGHWPHGAVKFDWNIPWSPDGAYPQGLIAGCWGIRENETRMLCIPPEEGYSMVSILQHI